MSVNSEITGQIHSLQSLGTLDGPGIRFVVFTQGCTLRCGCCHNPDTWSVNGGSEYTVTELIDKIVRYKSFFGNDGGVTVSGGEPLMQAKFVKDLFIACHKNGIDTCLDTSGSILNDSVKELLKHTDRVLLDIKYTDDEMYREYVGCSIDAPMKFLEYLNSENIPTVLRQVIIPSLNDNEGNIQKLREIADSHPCVEKVELLPFKKICKVKYDNMGIEFPFDVYPAANKEAVDKLQTLLT